MIDVRSEMGSMVPIGTLVNIEDAFGPQVVRRYNLYASAAVNGLPAAGVSSGQALLTLEKLARERLKTRLREEMREGVR